MTEVEKFVPNVGKILVKLERQPEQKTESGLILPNIGEEDEKNIRGIVVKENSEPIIREGAEVLFSENSYKDITLDGKPYKIVSEKSVYLFTEQ